MGPNFSWLEEVGHGLEQQGGRRQRTGDLWDAVRRNCVEKRMYLLLQADQRLKQIREDLALLAHLQELYLSVKDIGLMQSQELIRISLTHYQNDWVLFFVMVLYFEKKMERLNSGDSKIVFGTKLRSIMAGGGGNKNIFQYCTDPSGQEILYLRALQGHSGRNPIDLSLQDNVLISNYFFEYIYHIGCAINSLHHKFRIDTVRTKFERSKKDRQYSLRLWILWIKNTKIRMRLTWTHHVLHGTSRKKWKRHQDTVYWVDIQLAQQKGLKFYQTRCNAIILYDALPVYCISRALAMKSEEIIYQTVYVSPQPPPTISYKGNWTCNLDPDVARSSKDIQRI